MKNIKEKTRWAVALGCAALITLMNGCGGGSDAPSSSSLPEGSAKRNETLIAIGEKFANLDLEQMEKVVEQTRFYGTPDEGMAVLSGEELPKTMEKVVAFCVAHGIVDKAPVLSFGDASQAGDSAVRFDPTYIRKVKEGATQASSGDSPPTFSLAWSEYPSWSVFGVADMNGIINGKKGELGPVEKKWGIDIELKEAEYDPCLAMYGAGGCDAVCITNMDILGPALGRPGVMVLPTSTSFGADACLVTANIKSVEDLKGKKVYGLENTVSEYCFVRNIELLGQSEADFTFSNMDPGAAALAMQQGNADQQAIVVWNPFVISTLAKRSDVRVLFDSTKIPNEIIDSVVVAKSSLERKGGEAFACAVIDAFYEINKALAP